MNSDGMYGMGWTPLGDPERTGENEYGEGFGDGRGLVFNRRFCISAPKALGDVGYIMC